MMKIALIGDSIRGNYEPHVRQLAGDDHEIHSPDENCRFSSYICDDTVHLTQTGAEMCARLVLDRIKGK